MTHSSSPTRVPVGFRFHPTDEELVGYYLPKKVAAKHIDLDLIRELDLYKLEPWDLQEQCRVDLDASGEKQTDYYFFSRKDKKYPTGNRANRATTAGFWKATGRDKPICTSKLLVGQQQLIGMRKTLVFYEGRAPHGNKTDWIMHEFRLDDGPGMPANDDGGWVVCRVFKKTKNFKMKTSCSDERAVSFEGQFGLMPENIMSSPEILSGSASYNPGSLLDFPAAATCKQEINLDTYNNVVVPSAYHSDPFNAQLAQLAMNKLDCCNHPAMQQPAHELSSGSFHEGQLVGRDISCRTRDTTGSFFTEQYAATTLENDHHVDSPASSCFFPEAAHCSSTHCNPEEGFLAAYDDSWATTLYESKAGYKDLLRFPTSTTAVRAAAAGAADQSLGDVHILFQLRRQQHSDLIFPSSCVEQLDTWNFNQMYNQKLL
ncbi:hypothetical protein CY35_11G085400 [Sphagnum magellanicum]|jgi:hypothetical protein|uniref:VNS transcription factor n=1 Tax=Sphagnum palustre TaxID=13805 RepID=A0A6S4QKE9_SPHPA|nr:hypothetical protein CY35_11G085400 [Sphagnum magellanicum]BBK93931.1 VNS transcription factor [Sphagnum palustre]KAH9548373.1 hypothetical protein CY35_11G085400 [Sphagnum magellanicum]KAH9548374.1 hypothetical protein CY35_11G085400 [Sphagnum magellanicum]KAH9548375.1 hypothetical protein CY35_11G085400 [Sphagnum magellanicum]